MNQKITYLSQQEIVLRDENGQLQKRLRELIDANKEVTANYQAVKKNHDAKRREFEEIMSELEEAKSACQTVIRQKKTLQTELAASNKLKTELQEKNKAQETSLTKKEKELNDTLTRLSDIIADYEGKLAKKDEQIWAMGEQLSESNFISIASF
jgi:chromosome segregation ATPase